jgi:hypothetical protein
VTAASGGTAAAVHAVRVTHDGTATLTTGAAVSLTNVAARGQVELPAMHDCAISIVQLTLTAAATSGMTSAGLYFAGAVNSSTAFVNGLTMLAPQPATSAVLAAAWTDSNVTLCALAPATYTHVALPNTALHLCTRTQSASRTHTVVTRTSSVVTATHTVALPPPPGATATPPIEASASLVPVVVEPEALGDAAVVLASLVGPTAAKALAVTSVVAVGVSGFVSPSTANKGPNIARIAGTMSCGFDDDALKTSPLAVFIVWPMGGTEFRDLIGGVVVIFAFVLVLAGASVVLHSVALARMIVRRAEAKAWHFLISYMLPTAHGYITTIFFHADNAGDVAFATIAGIALLAAHGGALYAVARHLPTGTDAKFDAPEKQAGGKRLYAVYMLADGCLDARRQRLRVFFLEDVIASSLMAIVAGIKPEGERCTLMAVLILVIAVPHAAYVTFLRPYEDNVENGFAIALGFGQVALASAAVWGTSDRESAAARDTAAGVILCLFGVLFLQTVVLVGMWLYEQFVKWRARVKATAGTSATAAGVAPQLQADLMGGEESDSDLGLEVGSDTEHAAPPFRRAPSIVLPVPVTAPTAAAVALPPPPPALPPCTPPPSSPTAPRLPSPLPRVAKPPTFGGFITDADAIEEARNTLPSDQMPVACTGGRRRRVPKAGVVRRVALEGSEGQAQGFALPLHSDDVEMGDVPVEEEVDPATAEAEAEAEAEVAAQMGEEGDSDDSLL